MSGVRTLTVETGEAGQRLDRWFRNRFPEVSHGLLEKWLRTGQVRLDGGRVKANVRVAAGQTVRVPPLGDAPARLEPRPAPTARLSDGEAADLRARVLYRDADVLAIDKPAGLAVQGGTGTDRHLDAMLDALAFDAPERPRLVHRLDKDTSGVLLLARSAEAARWLGEAFRAKDALKIYWALAVGLPRYAAGRIDLPLAKRPGRAGEKMAHDEDEGKRAITDYVVVDRAANRACWLAMAPRTGRTHQLRAHCAAIGTPILGDGKYGGADAFLGGGNFDRQIHLHARAIRMPRPDGRLIEAVAPLPAHMRRAMGFLGFDEATAAEPFAALAVMDDRTK